MGLMKNNSLWLSMRADPKVPLRFQARSDDGGKTYTSESQPRPAAFSQRAVKTRLSQPAVKTESD